MAERRRDIKTREAVEEALQRRDIDDLNKTLADGFKGIHDRQDITNGRVGKVEEEVEKLESWQSFIKGGLAVVSAFLVPVILYIIIKEL